MLTFFVQGNFLDITILSVFTLPLGIALLEQWNSFFSISTTSNFSNLFLPTLYSSLIKLVTTSASTLFGWLFFCFLQHILGMIFYVFHVFFLILFVFLRHFFVFFFHICWFFSFCHILISISIILSFFSSSDNAFYWSQAIFSLHLLSSYFLVAIWLPYGQLWELARPLCFPADVYRRWGKWTVDRRMEAVNFKMKIRKQKFILVTV